MWEKYSLFGSCFKISKVIKSKPSAFFVGKFLIAILLSFGLTGLSGRHNCMSLFQKFCDFFSITIIRIHKIRYENFRFFNIAESICRHPVSVEI